MEVIAVKVKGIATLGDGTEQEIDVELEVTEQGTSEDGTVHVYGVGDAWRAAFKPAPHLRSET